MIARIALCLGFYGLAMISAGGGLSVLWGPQTAVYVLVILHCLLALWGIILGIIAAPDPEMEEEDIDPSEATTERQVVRRW